MVESCSITARYPLTHEVIEMGNSKIEWNLKDPHFLPGCLVPDCNTKCPQIGTADGNFIHVCPDHGIFAVDRNGNVIERKVTWTKNSKIRFTSY